MSCWICDGKKNEFMNKEHAGKKLNAKKTNNFIFADEIVRARSGKQIFYFNKKRKRSKVSSIFIIHPLRIHIKNISHLIFVVAPYKKKVWQIRADTIKEDEHWNKVWARRVDDLVQAHEWKVARNWWNGNCACRSRCCWCQHLCYIYRSNTYEFKVQPISLAVKKPS